MFIKPSFELNKIDENCYVTEKGLAEFFRITIKQSERWFYRMKIKSFVIGDDPYKKRWYSLKEIIDYLKNKYE